MPGVGLFAFIGFDSVSPAEMLILCAVILIVVGPKGLPSAARKVGAFMANLRRAADEFKRQLMSMDVESSTPSTSVPDPEPPPASTVEASSDTETPALDPNSPEAAYPGHTPYIDVPESAASEPTGESKSESSAGNEVQPGVTDRAETESVAPETSVSESESK